MNQKLLVLMAAWIAVTLMPSCGHDQQLVSIVIQPATQTFGSASTPVSDNAGLTVHLRVLGSYIHPPVTKDITDQVSWASSRPDIVTVSSGGLLTATGTACGNALVSATVTTNKSAGNISSSGALVTGI
jgi:Bacterial Ig-like domain (group 2)